MVDGWVDDFAGTDFNDGRKNTAVRALDGAEFLGHVRIHVFG